MIRICAVVALFTARMIAIVFDLGASKPPIDWQSNVQVAHELSAEPPVTIISGLPQDAGTLRR